MDKETLERLSARDFIKTAFLKLLEKSPFEKITVSQIVQMAGISRSTFYLHFQDKFDLMEHITNQITDEFISYYGQNERDLQKLDLNLSIQDTTLNICTHILLNKDFYRERFKNQIFIQYLTEKLIDQLIIIFQNKAYAVFAGYGTIGYITQWVHDEFKLSTIEAAAELTGIGLLNWSEFGVVMNIVENKKRSI